MHVLVVVEYKYLFIRNKLETGNGTGNKSKVVLADGEVVHTAGKGSRPSKVRK